MIKVRHFFFNSRQKNLSVKSDELFCQWQNFLPTFFLPIRYYKVNIHAAFSKIQLRQIRNKQLINYCENAAY